MTSWAARVQMASNMGSVRVPVKVFCWLRVIGADQQAASDPDLHAVAEAGRGTRDGFPAFPEDSQ